jgi:hypothetical protein
MTLELDGVHAGVRVAILSLQPFGRARSNRLDVTVMA